MNFKFVIICSVYFLGLVACGTTKQNAFENVVLGMTADQVTSELGEPARRSSRGTYDAFRYENVITVKSGTCIYESGIKRCKNTHRCQYMTVWLEGEIVKSVTQRSDLDLKDCGSGLEPEDWRLMPGT